MAVESLHTLQKQGRKLMSAGLLIAAIGSTSPVEAAPAHRKSPNSSALSWLIGPRIKDIQNGAIKETLSYDHESHTFAFDAEVATTAPIHEDAGVVISIQKRHGNGHWKEIPAEIPTPRISAYNSKGFGEYLHETGERTLTQHDVFEVQKARIHGDTVRVIAEMPTYHDAQLIRTDFRP